MRKFLTAGLTTSVLLATATAASAVKPQRRPSAQLRNGKDCACQRLTNVHGVHQPARSSHSGSALYRSTCRTKRQKPRRHRARLPGPEGTSTVCPKYFRRHRGPITGTAIGQGKFTLDGKRTNVPVNTDHLAAGGRSSKLTRYLGNVDKVESGSKPSVTLTYVSPTATRFSRQTPHGHPPPTRSTTRTS